ncbi:hypothetical protein NC652_013629 [Populus alba x Populus x berolinensis]|nr:hypothetical protein NC652_013629 [Populus alba x Populus x berolinensis]
MCGMPLFSLRLWTSNHGIIHQKKTLSLTHTASSSSSWMTNFRQIHWFMRDRQTHKACLVLKMALEVSASSWQWHGIGVGISIHLPILPFVCQSLIEWWVISSK